MEKTLIEYTCPSCGSPLYFDPEHQNLSCEACDSTFPQDFFDVSHENAGDVNVEDKPTGRIDWRVAGFVDAKTKTEEQRGYHCQSCGAEIIVTDSVATECMYCKSPVVIATNISGMVTPDYILPFKISKDEAKQLLRNHCSKKKILPSLFKDEQEVAKITGMYVPFWLFTGKGDGAIKYNATKVRTWQDSTYTYTNTKHYAIYREGSVSFDKVPVDASKKMDDAYMEGLEPFNFSDAVPFSPSFMAGFFADKFDEDVDDSLQRAIPRVVASVEDTFKDSVRGYTTVIKSASNVQMHGEDIHYALLPVWMLNTRYNDEIYSFAINGQTGQISGKLPVDKLKLLYQFLSKSLIYSAVFTVIAAIVVWLIG